jgi:hypothetical protein
VPSVSLEIHVSRRESDRPRLLQVQAFDHNGAIEGMNVTVKVDQAGTFDQEAELRRRELVTGAHGIALFQWYEWPRHGQGRDFTSTVTATWEDEGGIVYLEDLYE